MIRPRSLTVAAALAVVLTVPAAASAKCANSDRVTAELSPAAARATIACLINGQRARQDLNQLKAEPHLVRTARSHAADMVRRRFFAHVNPEGLGVVARARKAGYTRGFRRYQVRENIGWRYGSNATPGRMIEVWMQSSEHRKHILGAWKHIGVAVVRGAPVSGFDSDPTAVTFTIEFGRRA